MDNRVVLQIPISQTLRKNAEDAASDFGFSSLQEFIRVIMTKLAEGKLDFTFSERKALSAKADTRYTKMDADFRNRKNIYKVSNVKSLIKDLN